MRASIFLICLFIFTILVSAQEPLSSEPPARLFAQGLEAFDLGAYGATEGLMQQYLDTRPEAHVPEARYYLALARLRAGSTEGIPNMLAFIEDESMHPLAGKAFFVLGNHFFANEDFTRALTYFKQVNSLQLDARSEEEWHFKQAYSQWKTGSADAAETEFELVLNYRGAYFEEASYYLGAILFQNQDYHRALTVLESIDGKQGPYSDDVTVMISAIYFHTNQLSRLYRYAGDQVTSAVTEKNKQLSKLLGEAYFSEKKYPKSAEYLQRYLDFSGNRVDAETFYRLGYAYFQTGANTKAIENFKKSGLEKGPIGQVSSFYLGQLYLKEGNLNYAYSAFKTVAKEGASEAMKEEASFTMGKVNFQRGQFADAIADFSAFLSQFPSSRWRTEANELLAQAYLKTSNYDQAIAHLESIRNKSTSLQQAYQRVTLQKGQLLFNDSRFQQALVYFDKSIAFPVHRELAAQAYYLKGECHALLNQSGQAREAYQKCTTMGSNQWAVRAQYGLGYVAYNAKEYAGARGYFTSFLERSSPTDQFYQDALIRLADCQYVLKQYSEAIRTYGRVSAPQLQPYVNYQLGLVHRMNGDDKKAQTAFQKAISAPQSEYGDLALFQLSELHIEAGDFRKALTVLEQLLNDYPDGSLQPYAKSQQALCYFNLAQYDESRKAYEYVLKHHMNHKVANSALLGLQELIKKGVAVDGFESWMRDFEQAHPDDNSLEVVTFEAAKGLYYNQKYGQAADKLKAFMEKYPASGFMEDARYFLADSYFRNERWQEAAQTFEGLIESGSTAYTGRSLDKRGKALVALGDLKGAIGNYRMLLTNALNQKETYLANEGLMTTYFQMNMADSSLHFADQILQNDWKPANAEAVAWLIKGKVYIQKKSYPLAMDEFIKVANDSKSEHSAEAKYMMGKTYFLQGQHKRSLEVLFDLNRNYGSYPWWIGQSFLLVVDNYLAMGEVLQARATAESIIQNATIEEIKAEATKKLRKIVAEESKLLTSDSLNQDTIR